MRSEQARRKLRKWKRPTQAPDWSEVITFKCTTCRTDGKDAAPAFHEHATHFLKQEQEKNELGDDEYTAGFFQEYDDFRNEEFAVPVPPVQPDGTFDPDETATFEITG